MLLNISPIELYSISIKQLPDSATHEARPPNTNGRQSNISYHLETTEIIGLFFRFVFYFIKSFK